MVGRFQHIHKGHEKLINEGLKLCDTFLILYISNKKKDINNPFSDEYKLNLINIIYEKEITSKRLIVKCIDNNLKYDHTYGEYIIKYIQKEFKMFPNLVVYGSDKDITKCFSNEIINNINQVKVDRNKINISATKLRKYIIEDDYENWKKYVNKKIYKEYIKLKEDLNG